MVVTVQTAEWMKQIRIKEGGIPNIQYENSYEGTRHPFDLPDFLNFSWHPKPSMLNLKVSHGGEWIKIPTDREDQTGPDYSSYIVGRL